MMEVEIMQGRDDEKEKYGVHKREERRWESWSKKV